MQKLVCATLFVHGGSLFRSLDPHIHAYPDHLSRLVGMRRGSNGRGSACSESQQYRAKATECGELVLSSASAQERRDSQDLKDRFVWWRITGEGIADTHKDACK